MHEVQKLQQERQKAEQEHSYAASSVKQLDDMICLTSSEEPKDENDASEQAALQQKLFDLQSVRLARGGGFGGVSPSTESPPSQRVAENGRR